MNARKKNKPEYPTLCEYRSKRFLNIATAVGLGVSAAAISIELKAEEEKAADTEKAEKPEKEIKEKIILLLADLGHSEFKKRDKATKELIFLGHKLKKENQSGLSEFLKAELEKCKSSKNPEVKERSKRVLLALAPPPPQPPNDSVPQIGGVMPMPQPPAH